MTTLSLGWRILRAEGVRSFGERALERWDEARERRSYRPLGSSRFSLDLLNLSPVPPSPRRGGVETQLAARRRAESRLRTIALLFPLDGRYRLEIDDRTEARARRYAADLGPAPKLTTYGFEVLEPRALGAAVEAARGLTGVRNVHVENPAGFDLGALGSLVATFDAAVLSVHDHSLFCPRSDLFSPPLNAFCSYSTDRVTCASCLRAPEGWQETRRVQSQQLLDQVASVIFPSPYLLAVHEELFAAIDTTRWHTIAPAAETLPAPLSSLEKQRIAYVGAARPAKGANLFADLVSHLSTRHHNLEFHAFGGGDPAVLACFRSLGIWVHGYYRTGTLPRRLAAENIGLALLPSVVPESYNLAVDECARAGVPSVVLDLGAPAELVRELGLGRVATTTSVGGSRVSLNDLIEDHLRQPIPRPSPEAIASLPSPRLVAAAAVECYRLRSVSRE